ncbi:putative ribosome quality control (RQC) complex YloA/Tae2 family protein [Methanomicrobium sp. W14]|uniref:ribosome rescue protein RqcH n=1 Tax=Methanomicrobium sp. W14 TaxID=2817839 RepID=UPI001AE2588F|nr:ribosome rescue protein RqcH [Methanomicrobium sp. W14]MBP2132993.1 putative ribosome quality control (RQC) complex YloA/Tae2 family protein [Methanomicrobium sp. W14]
MATQKGMSGIDLYAMLSELKSCLPLWIGKIYQYNNETFGFRLNGDDHQKYNFLVECSRRAHISEKLPPAPKNPSGYSMFLRKYISGGRILDITQYGIQRIVDFKIGKTEQVLHLIFELFDEGNAILCDNNYIIQNPLKNHRFRDREVLPGVRYELPEEIIYPENIEKTSLLLKKSDKNLVKTIASYFMTGGNYAEEICRISDYDKNMDVQLADPETIFKAFSEVLSRCTDNKNPVITGSGCWPFLFEGEKPVQEFESYNNALNSFYPLPEEEEKDAKPVLSKEEVIRNRQKKAIEGFEKNIILIQKKVDLIYSNYQLVSEIINTLNEAGKNHSWQEIENILKESSISAAKAILKVYPKNASVDVKIEDVAVRIYIHESIEVNANRYYSEIKKYKKKKNGAIKAMEKFAPVKKPEKKKEITLLKPKWYHRFRWFYTSDGVLVIGGRDAGTNEEIVKKYMEGNDTFVHADVHGGSVVIVKGETRFWDEVSVFAASYSNIWKSGHFYGDVYAAKREQVSKTAESGEFVARGAFVIRGERKYFRDVSLGVAIGLQYEPAVAVIGGPVSAVKKRAKYYVVLKPGTFEPNDAARKVLRNLKDIIPEGDFKSLKSVLNTEAIAAFVPPGGSDIETGVLNEG